MFRKIKSNGIVISIFSLGLRTLLQLGFFVILARFLSISDYGTFTTIVATCALLSPFANMGTGISMLKDISRDSGDQSKLWSNSLITTIFFGFFVSILAYIVLANLVESQNSMLSIIIILVCCNEIFFNKLFEINIQFCQAKNDIIGMTKLNYVFSALKLLSIAYGAHFHSTNPLLSWSIIYFASSAISFIISFHYIRKKFNNQFILNEWNLRKSFNGISYAMGLSVQSGNSDIMKILIFNSFGSERAGIFNATIRLVEMTLIPSRGLLSASQAKIFSVSNNVRRVVIYKMMLFSLLTTGGLLVSMYLLRDYIPYVIGGKYKAITEIVSVMAVFGLIKSISVILQDNLSGLDMQWIRVIGNLLGITSILLFYLLESGAIFETYIIALIVSELAVVLLSSVFIFTNTRKSNRSTV